VGYQTDTAIQVLRSNDMFRGLTRRFFGEIPLLNLQRISFSGFPVVPVGIRSAFSSIDQWIFPES
jgi:hypothetical protein